MPVCQDRRHGLLGHLLVRRILRVHPSGLFVGSCACTLRARRGPRRTRRFWHSIRRPETPQQSGRCRCRLPMRPSRPSDGAPTCSVASRAPHSPPSRSHSSTCNKTPLPTRSAQRLAANSRNWQLGLGGCEECDDSNWSNPAGSSIDVLEPQGKERLSDRRTSRNRAALATY